MATDRATVAAVHLADVGVGRWLRQALRAPAPQSVPGLRHADSGFVAPLGRNVPTLNVGRVGLLSWWDSDEALSEFNESHPYARPFRDGWQVRLRPLRATGSWPGLPQGLTPHRRIEQPGPYVVLTLGWLRLSRARAFLAASRKAEKAVLESEVQWATALVRPPFVATISVWGTQDELRSYAFDGEDARHPDAVRAGRQRPFHKREAFVRFQVDRVSGQLSGRNAPPAQLP